MHRILALCTAIALYSCGSDEEPVFRPTVARPKARSVRRARTFFFATHLPRRRDRQRVWNLRGEAISGSLVGETLTQIPGYSRRYDRDLYISSGYTQSSKIWFPQTPGIDDCFHPKDMVLGLLGADTAKAFPFSRLAARGARAVVNDVFAGRDIVVFFQQDAHTALAFDRRAGGQSLSFELVE